MSYPKWKFKGDQRKLVETPEDEKALGSGWGDAPGVTATAANDTSKAAQDDEEDDDIELPKANKKK